MLFDYASILQLMATSSINQKLPTLPPSYSAMFLEKTKPQSVWCSAWQVFLWACPWRLKSSWKSMHEEGGGTRRVYVQYKAFWRETYSWNA